MLSDINAIPNDILKATTGIHSMSLNDKTESINIKKKGEKSTLKSIISHR